MASELDYKSKFAEYLVEGLQPLEAAMRTFKPDGYNNASFLMKVAKEWPSDPDVVTFRNEIEANTTSETKFKAQLWNEVKATRGARENPALWRLYAEVAGFIKANSGGKKGEGTDGADKLQELRDMFL